MLQQDMQSSAGKANDRANLRFLDALRVLPIRSRILLIAALNIIVAIVFAAVIWDGTRDLAAARNDLRLTRDSERLLTAVGTQIERLQSLIHRYFTQPDVEVLKEITTLRESVTETLVNRAT